MCDGKELVIDGQLSFVMRDCVSIPVHLAVKHGETVVRIDLSDNCIKSLAGLEQFLTLEEVVLDKNELTDSDLVTMPLMPNVHTLSLNKNKITDLDGLLSVIKSKLPSLKYLSILGNPACPDQLSSSDKDDDDYRRYRLYVIFNLPKLNFLDFSPVKDVDRREAAQQGPFLKVVRPDDTQLLGANHTEKTEKSPYRPLSQTLKSEDPKLKGTYGKCKYVYYGKHSEGNRFIRNSDL
jgi:hypothetical protein